MSKQLKAILALVICAVLCLCPLSVTATADDGLTRVTPSGNAALVNHTLSGDKAVLSKEPTSTNMQSYENIESVGFIDKTYAASVSFRVSAPAAGEYTVKPEFTVSGSSVAGYFITLCVNDSSVQKYAVSNSGSHCPELTVSLEKGVNIIRVITVVKDTAALYAGIDSISVDALWIDDALTAVSKNTSLALLPNDASYKNYYAEGSDGAVGGAGSCISNAKEQGLTPQNIKVGSVHTMPYFAFTVTVPADGYYDISLMSNTGATGATGKIVVFVDEVKTVKNFIDYRYDGMFNTSVYIPSGTHTLSFTSVFDWSSDTAVGGVTEEYYRTWSNYYKVVFEDGNVSLADTQVDPSTINDPTRLEAENANSIIESSDIGQTGNRYSGKKCVGNFTDNFTRIQSYSSLATYFDKSNTQSVSFSVVAPADDTYTFTPRYYLYTNRDSYYMTAVVNDSQFYKVNFVESGTNSGMNSNSFSATLTKGVNVVRLIIATSDLATVMSGNYVNLDCLDIDSRLTANTSKIRIEAESSKFYSYASDNGVAIANINTSKALSHTVNTSTLSDTNWTVCPHFTYSLYAPQDGYYDIDLLFRSGYDFGDVYNFGMIVDGSVLIKPHRRHHTNNTFDNCKANMSVYLTNGDHNIVFTSQLPDSDSTEYFWNDFDALELHGGLTFAALQEDPFIITYEGEDAYLNNFISEYNSSITYSNDRFAGIWNFNYTQHIDELSTYIDPNTGYTVFSIVAPEDGKYSIRVRFKFGCQGSTPDADYEAYTEKYGHKPYAVLVTNGNTYKAYHPTQANWISTANSIKLDLKQGINKVYAMAPTTEVAAEFTNAYIEYDCIYMPANLSIAAPNYYTLGDINSDECVDIKDLLRVKLYLAGQTSSADLTAANFTASSSYGITANTLAQMEKMLLVAGTSEGSAFGGAQEPIKNAATPDGKVEIDNSNIYFSPYSWHKGDGFRLAAIGGAYLKAAFTGTSFAAKVDPSRLGYIGADRIFVNAYIDGSTEPVRLTLANADSQKYVTFASGLTSGNHYIEIYFACSDDEPAYPRGSQNGLRFTGFKIDAGAKMLDLSTVGEAPKSKKILFYGDSITEGVGCWGNYEKGYAPTLGKKLGYEYGQCGNAGIGWAGGGCRSFIPFYDETNDEGFWQTYIQDVSRMVDGDYTKGYIDGCPDAVVINMGENDARNTISQELIQARTTGWLTAMRKTIGYDAKIFVIIPFNYGGTLYAHYANLKTALYDGVADYKSANPTDSNIHLIDLGEEAWNVVDINSSDDVHPNATGASILADMLYEQIKPILG